MANRSSHSVHDPKANSVKSLAELYTVVIGVALSVAILSTVNKDHPELPVHLSTLPTLAAFVALVIPFYHGAMRHLFATYVEEGTRAREVKSIALLADFIILFVEGCLFVLMGSVVAKPTSFLWVAVALLLIDTVWGFVAWLAFAEPASEYAEKRWAKINIVATVLLSLFLVLSRGHWPPDDPTIVWVGFIGLTARTVVDYVWTWPFYFPD